MQVDVDWNQFETLLVELTTRDVAAFSATHSNETFYGFMFDCNSDYGRVLLCLNTEADLQANAEASKERSADALLDELPASLRWNAGDWKYQGFNSPDFDTAWEPLETIVSDICMDEEEDEETFLTPTQDRFMKSVCRVLVRLETAGAFDCLRQTENFKAYVADHDELESESWDRLASVRAGLNQGHPFPS